MCRAPSLGTGGASTEDLRALLRQNISMDMITFMKLRKEALLVWPAEGRGPWRVSPGKGGTTEKGWPWLWGACEGRATEGVGSWERRGH